MNDQQLVIRPVAEAEVDQLESLQQAIWGMSDMEVIPGRVLHALQFNGSVVLGAYDGSNLVGFVVGIVGRLPTTDQYHLYSAIMGVLPAYQNRHVGYQLKMAQASVARQMGLSCITWTYDPLESRNARLNIGKLGAICRRYLPNFHGTMTGINAGIPSDRFYVEWYIEDEPVLRRLLAPTQQPTFQQLMLEGAVLLNRSNWNEQGLPEPPAGFAQNAPSSMLLVEIPARFQQLKSQNFTLAQRWRERTGQIFSYYFKVGYVVTDFFKWSDDSGRERTFYLLTHHYT